MIQKTGQFIFPHRAVFYILWLVINLIQAGNTELFHDEAYYWMYSLFPAWGYFDHPPVIAVVIKAGYNLFHNEFGVRIVTVLMNTACIYLTEILINKKNPFLFYAICGSIAIAHIGGILAVPDTTLMFFVALFFFLYRRFILNMDLLNTLLLALSMTLMVYTKYHGILIIIFTGLSNLKLLRHYQAYLALLIAVIFFIPHIYWQYLNEFPTIQFHLFERNSPEYELSNTITFIVGQIIMAGPYIGWLLIAAALMHKPVDLTERALKFSLIGIYFFFLFSTIKGEAEANWTVPGFIGLIILSHQYLTGHPVLRRWLYFSVPITMATVLIIRIIMLINIEPVDWLIKDEFHRNGNWVNEIRLKADGHPVVFTDSYQKPSKYWFYSGKIAMSLNTPFYRRNNFNYWSIEDSLIGKTIYLVGNKKVIKDGDMFSEQILKQNSGKKIDNYFSFSRLLIKSVSSASVGPNRISLRFTVKSPPSYLSFFQRSPYDTCALYLNLYTKGNLIECVPVNMKVKDIVTPLQHNLVTVDVQHPENNYTAKFIISSCLPGLPSLNSAPFKLK